jgi:hypothetical protein
MASYHFSVQIIQRSKGRSAIAAAAYRSGTLLRDERSGGAHDYRKRRGVVFSGVMLPDGAPEPLRDRQALWSRVESLEWRRDAQLAREINIALPHELDVAQRQELILNFVQEAFVQHGMAADVAIHEPVPGRNESQDNHHAHVMLPLRRVTRAGLHPVKTREWNSRDLLKRWRALWAQHQNRALERAGFAVRVDHRTLAAQRADALSRGDRAAAVRLDRTPQVHVGRRARHAVLAQRPIRSRERPVGPYRKNGKGKAVRRVVKYHVIDKGTRLAYRAALLERQRERFRGKVKAWQARAAQLRLRKLALVRDDIRLREQLRQMLNQQHRFRWLERKERSWTMTEAMWELVPRLEQRRRRIGVVERMIAEVDRALSLLLLEPARPVTRQPVRLVPVPGRVRARRPIASATARPGNDGPCGPGSAGSR